MAPSRFAPAVLAALAAATGCGSESDRSSPAAAAATTAIPLGPAPPGVGQLCGIVALDRQQVLCPTRFPARRGSQADGQMLSSERDPGYLLEWRVGGFRGGLVTVGGHPRPYRLSGRRVSAAPTLRGPLTVLRREVRIGTARGVVVRTPERHVAVLWNQSRRGYMTALGFGGHPLRDRLAAAVRVARSSAPVQPGGGCDPSAGPTDCG